VCCNTHKFSAPGAIVTPASSDISSGWHGLQRVLTRLKQDAWDGSVLLHSQTRTQSARLTRAVQQSAAVFVQRATAARVCCANTCPYTETQHMHRGCTSSNNDCVARLTSTSTTVAFAVAHTRVIPGGGGGNGFCNGGGGNAPCI
jgi:hypothetical protein